jgi:uncharacterized membrane protein
VDWPFYVIVYVRACFGKWISTPVLHTKHRTTNWKTYILYVTGDVHYTFQNTAAVLVGTLLHLYLTDGMEFHLRFKPRAYCMVIYLHSISVILISLCWSYAIPCNYRVNFFRLVFCVCPGQQGHRNFTVVIILTLFGNVVTVLSVLYDILWCNVDFHKTQCENIITSFVDHNHNLLYSVVCP